MKIEVWSDVVCPWCWLGKKRLEKAIAGFAHRDEVEVVFHAFELDPRAPKDLDVPSSEHVAKKYGLGRAQLDAMHARMRGLGEADGIDFRFERARTSNTFEAHQLIQLAAAHGRQLAMTERLFFAQFHEGVRVGDRAELVCLAGEVGLDVADVGRALEEGRYAKAVRADEAQASALGITGVPFYVVDGAIGVSGAQPVELLVEVLEKAWEKRPAPKGDDAAGACDDESCDV
jgi:predicted DsbA family dithiol-disulfide isomerase